MKAPQRSIEESRRLDALRQYTILNIQPEDALDDLVALTAQICGTSAAAISFVDERRLWFKARVGIEEVEVPREHSFCGQALGNGDLFVVPDARKDPRFKRNPLVAGPAGIRFYAGVPLRTPDGSELGHLCVLDAGTRELTPSQIQSLRVLGRQVMVQLELRRQGQELRASEERFVSAFEHAPAGIALVTPDGRWLKVNRAVCRLFGYSEAELLATSFGEITHPEDLAGNLDSARRMLAGEFTTYQLENRYLHSSGEVIWGLLSVSLVWDPAGQPVHFILQVEDITQRKRAEEALRASEERYRALFEYAPDGIVIADSSSSYIDANARMCRMLGYTRDELIGLQASDIVVAADVPFIEPAMDVIKTRSEYQREWRFLRKDGTVFAAEEIAALMPDGNLLGMVRDISERKRTEERFRRLVDSNVQGVIFWHLDGGITVANDAFLRILGFSREDLDAGLLNWITLTPPEYADRDRQALEQISAGKSCVPFEKEFIRKDGTRAAVLVGASAFEDDPTEGVCFVLDLTERKMLDRQFLRAQRMESIGTLAGGIAHDLNNVLAPIIMSLELLKMKFPDPASAEFLAIISSSATRGSDMVRQVLSFARGVEGRRMVVQVRHLIQEIEKILTDTFLKDIKMRTQVASDLWTVIGDPTQLHQVLLNLCVNARDAMPDGGILGFTVENLMLDSHYAGLNPEAKPGPYVLIQVQDNGTGMPPEVMENVFDPFFTTKNVGKGTGLGLSTSLAIVKSHGGFIQVYSEPGMGTTFKIYLPAETDPATATAVERIAGLPCGRGELILVVDDEASVREITRQTLEAFGYRVLLASDGAEALAQYASRGPDIAGVITDMTMPVMDGPATIQVLLQMNPDLPLIASSGLSASGHIASAANLGVRHFLPKPYTAETLLNVLKEALSGELPDGIRGD